MTKVDGPAGQAAPVQPAQVTGQSQVVEVVAPMPEGQAAAAVAAAANQAGLTVPVVGLAAPRAPVSEQADSVAAVAVSGGAANAAAALVAATGNDGKDLEQDRHGSGESDGAAPTFSLTGSTPRSAEGGSAHRAIQDFQAAAHAAAAEVPEAAPESGVLGGRTRIVVGSGDDQVALLITMHAHGVDVVAQSASAATAAALGRSSGELDAALRPHGLALLGFASGGSDERASGGGGARDDRGSHGARGDADDAASSSISPDEAATRPLRGVRVLA